MPSFDITSEFNKQEVTNAVDQCKREIVNRYDFKNTHTIVSNTDTTININSSTDYSDEETPSEIKRSYTLKSGIETPKAKEIVKYIKELDKKVQASIQDRSVRVTSKKKDSLQMIMNAIKEENFEIHLTFGNFRD